MIIGCAICKIFVPFDQIVLRHLYFLIQLHIISQRGSGLLCHLSTDRHLGNTITFAPKCILGLRFHVA